MKSYNKAIIMGNLAADPELKSFDGGKQCCNFTVAVNRKWVGPEGQEGEEVSFIDCQAWGGLAGTINEHFSKGRAIFLEGRLKQEKWDDKETGKKQSRIRVLVESFNFIDSKKDAIPAMAGGEMDDEVFDNL